MKNAINGLKITRKTNVKPVLVLLLMVSGIIIVFLTAKLLGGGEEVSSEKPLVICQPQHLPPEQQQCFWTAHIHTLIKISKDGEEINTGFESGELEEHHTHAEKDKIHWHGLLSVDPITREVKDQSPLKVGNIPKNFGILIDGNPKFIVNNKEVNSSYIWQDGDTIEIIYE